MLCLLRTALVETLLRRTLPKPPHLRCGNWETCPLKKDQKQYAALDAFASLAVYCSLASRPLRRPMQDAGTAVS